MKHLIQSLAALTVAAALICAPMAHAAPAVETFDQLTTTTPPTFGNSTIPGGDWAEIFAPGLFDRLGLEDNAGSKFPASADNKYLTTSRNVNQGLGLELATTVPLTAGALQVAIPIRVDALQAGANGLDILVVRASTSNILGIVVDGSNNLRLANTNGVGATRIFSSAAFDSTNVANWNDGNWRTLLVRFTPAGGGAGAVKGWVLETNGTLTEVFNATGLTNSNVGAAGITRIGFGAFFAAAPGGFGTDVSIDNVTIYDSADESSFLAAAAADYTVGGVSEWNLY